MPPDCNAPADIQEFVYCTVTAAGDIVDTVVILGGILGTVAIALAGIRLIIRLVSMS